MLHHVPNAQGPARQIHIVHGQILACKNAARYAQRPLKRPETMIAKFVQITSKNIIIWVYDSKNYGLMGLRANLQPGGTNITNLQQDLER